MELEETAFFIFTLKHKHWIWEIFTIDGATGRDPCVMGHPPILAIVSLPHPLWRLVGPTSGGERQTSDHFRAHPPAV